MIRIDIASDFKDTGFKKASRATTSLSKQFQNLGRTLGLALSVTAVERFAASSIKAFADDQKAATALTKTLGNMGLAFEDPRVKQFISNLEATSGVLDDQLRPAMQAFLTTTGSVTKSQELLGTAIDVAAGSGENLLTVAQDISNAYVGNLKGLKKYNLGLTQAELASKSFAEIQAILAQQFSGQNAAYLDTYAGKLSQLKVAFANMQETIGKGLLDSFSILSGDRGIGGAISAIDKFAQKISNAMVGFATMVKQVNNIFSINGVGIFDVLYKIAGGGILDQFAKIGAQVRNAPKSFSQGMSVAGATDYYSSQDIQRKKAEEAAAKRAKALADAQKKAAAAQIKAQKDLQALKAAGSLFDLQKIQVEAALKGKISDEERTRLLLMKAVLEDNATEATRLSEQLKKSQDDTTKLMKDLASLKASDPFVDWDARIKAISDALIKLKAPNPFEGWPAYFASIGNLLANLGQQLTSIQASVTGLVSTAQSNSASAAAAAAATASSAAADTATANAAAADAVIVAADAAVVIANDAATAAADAAKAASDAIAAGSSSADALVDAAQNTAAAAAAAADAATTIADAAAAAGFVAATSDAVVAQDILKASEEALIIAGASLAQSPTSVSSAGGVFNPYSNQVRSQYDIVINVAGNVTSEQDLASYILDQLYNSQDAGDPVLVSSSRIR